MKIIKTMNQANSSSVDTSIQCSTVDGSSNKYDKTIQYIRCAIDELGKIAKDDVQAKEAIANLGVVLFDLK